MSTDFGGLERLYPEKTSYLSQVFKDTTNSYKLFWFLAILSLLERTEAHALTLIDVFAEMATAAWHPVCLYRLSLGRQDQLKQVVQNFQHQSGLPPNARLDTIRKEISRSTQVQSRLGTFARFVPKRFLAPWFAETLRGTPDFSRNRQIISCAAQSQLTPAPCPYFFSEDGYSIILNASWRTFSLENTAIVRDFAEHHLTSYLQRRNPSVPGVVNKLHAPMARQLTTARKFWRSVRSALESLGQLDRFRDVYSEQPLGTRFAVDHFLPWSFVVHDLLWNLTPVEPDTNSKKSDALPNLDLYLPRLARMHFGAVRVMAASPRVLDDYLESFRLDAAGLASLSEAGFIAKYREIIPPLAQIAANQGFHGGWVLKRGGVGVPSESGSVL